MTGMLCLAPVLAGFLAPALRPVFHLFGLDPSCLLYTSLALLKYFLCIFHCYIIMCQHDN